MAGRVVVNFNKAPSWRQWRYNGHQKMVMSDPVIDKRNNGRGAWKAIFPSTLSASSKIAIKIPIRFNVGLPVPHWSSVKAITDGLQQMDFSGTIPCRKYYDL